MLSRAAQLPRICLACRLGMSQRGATIPFRHSPSRNYEPQRRHASNYSPQSKERIEALISGALDDIESNSKGGSAGKRRGGRRGKRRPQGAGIDEFAEWELEPEPEPEANLSKDGDVSFGEEVEIAVEEARVQENAIIDELSTDNLPKVQSDPCTKQFRHDLVNRQSLGVDALGKPVEAFIIKNPNRLKFTRKEFPEYSEDVAPSDATGAPLTWQSVIPQMTDESDFSEEVWQNIEEIRPKDTTIVRRKDFDKLVEYLVDGFTQEQLVTYFSRGNWNKILENTPGPLYPWLVKQSTWSPAQANDWASLKPKQRQAVAILSGKWKLEIQEQIEGLGRTIVWLQPDTFNVIAKPFSATIERLSEDFLDRSNHERISSRLEECRLSIYTRKSTVTAILARLDEIVQTIESQSISVQQISSENLAKAVIEELGKTTKTALLYDEANSTLNVSWLPDANTFNAHTESPADVVLRLLKGKSTVSQNADAQILSNVKPKKGAFLTHQRDKRSMAWRDKLRNWSRYINPVGNPTEKARKPLDFARNINLVQPDLQSPNDKLEIMATFGHILHTEQDIRPAKMAKARRILTPVIPHPAALTLITADTSAPSTQKTAIVLNFAPDSSSSTTVPSTAPQIRLCIPINPFADLSNFSFPDTSVLEAVIPCQESHILLPDESVDVRINQKRLIPLDAKQDSLQEFLHASEFNLLQGRLRTPSRTTFSIPKFPSSEQSTSMEASAALPYKFMGLEIHQTIDMEWRSHTLRYSSIEAGQHGGQQQKLTLMAEPPNGDGKPSPENLRDFLNLAEETACGEHFSWDEGYKLMKERSVEEFTWDMIDTEYTEQELISVKESNLDIPLEDSLGRQELDSSAEIEVAVEENSTENEVTDGEGVTATSSDTADDGTDSSSEKQS